MSHRVIEITLVTFVSVKKLPTSLVGSSVTTTRHPQYWYAAQLTYDWEI
jgi:hypothetical protein